MFASFRRLSWGSLRQRSIRKIVFTTISLTLASYALPASAAYLLEIDTDGADNGVLTYNPNFSFGGDTTSASQSITSLAYGTNGGDSIFGGDGSFVVDTYLYTYTPSADADNLAVPGGTNLGGGNLASGLAGGGTGTYRIYATWPYTENVSGGNVTYTISTPGSANVVAIVDQNFKGNEWILLGDISFTQSLESITVTQEAGLNTFVSMRSYGLLFERVDGAAVPAPASLAIIGIGLVGIGWARRRSAA